MAVARVSAGDPDAVRAMTKCRQDELGGHTSGARNPDDPKVGGILETTHPCQIRCPVAAPVA